MTSTTTVGLEIRERPSSGTRHSTCGTGKLALTRGTRACVLLASVVLLAGSAPAALAQANHAFAAGNDDYGQLGTGEDTWSPGPSLIAGVTAVAAGRGHSLAIRSDGTAWAWGANFNGQLGDGTKIDRLTPVEITKLTGATMVAGGGLHSLFAAQCPADLDTDGDVDVVDYVLFAACLSGPCAAPAGGCIANADVDGDTDVDLGDFAFFQAHFGES